MKPQFTIQDFGGEHNKDISKEWTRLNKAGSWKKQRIILILPTGDSIPAKVALSHWNLIFPPNNGVVRILAQGMEVGEAYSQAIENILAHPELSTWEYILTLEHDNMPPQEGVIKLVEDMETHPEFSCVGGLYYTKGEGGVPQLWGDPRDMPLNCRPQLPDPGGGLVECNGTGMGFNLFRLKMFKDKKLRKPWFKTVAGKEGVGTQDLYFWGDARKHGYRCAIDCSVRVGHYDNQNDIIW
jgi:hypothetical protein